MTEQNEAPPSYNEATGNVADGINYTAATPTTTANDKESTVINAEKETSEPISQEDQAANPSRGFGFNVGGVFVGIGYGKDISGVGLKLGDMLIGASTGAENGGKANS